MFLESFGQEIFWYIFGGGLNIIFKGTLDSILFDFLLKK
jgi:hypothetical protein